MSEEKDKTIKQILLPQTKGNSIYKIELPDRTREWMDVNNGHAYKCLPLSVANGFGWEIKNPVKFDAIWNGSIRHENAINFNFYPETDEEKLLVETNQISSHFGNGIVTFSSLNFIIKTSPGHNIFLKGPTNHFKHGAHALEAIIETDWLPYTFTLNWKITKPNILVKFEKNEPLACMFPFPRNYLESFEAIEEIGNPDSDLIKEQTKWAAIRADKKKEKGKKDHLMYSRGVEKSETNEKFEQHQRSIIGCPFMRKILGIKENKNDTNKE